MVLAELQAGRRVLGIAGTTRLRKGDLIAAITQLRTAVAARTAPSPHRQRRTRTRTGSAPARGAAPV